MTQTMLTALDQQMALSGEAQKPEGSLTSNVLTPRQLSGSSNVTLQLHILLQLYAYNYMHIIHQRPRIMIVYHMISEVIQNNLICIIRFHGVDIPMVFQWGHQ